MKRIRLIQISNGVGSGNIGDELMAQEFWKLLPGNVVLDVAVLPEADRFRGKYPAPHHYFPSASHPVLLPAVPGLLVGDTPVGESEGLAYPLEAVGPQISALTRRGLPVDAVGVGVDRLYQPAARELFARHYSAIRSWTVRSEGCREALLELGIAPEKVRVAADLAWLFTPGAETDDWAEALWRGLGVQRERPLLVVNLVHQANPAGGSAWQLLAEALDELARDDGYQVAFLHNETRPGPYYDAGATAAVRALMREPSMEVPGAYYTPQEMVSLLRWARTVLSQRYHMAIQAILAGTVPVCLERGQKLSGLAREFGLPTASLAVGSIVEGVKESMAGRPQRLQVLAARREEHRVRAGEVLSFLREELEQAARMPRRPVVNRVVIIHLGGLGDLVLASGLFAALRCQYPTAKLELFCRMALAGVAELFPAPPDQVIPVRFDPNAHAQPGLAVDHALRELAEQLGGGRPDVVVTAELEPTWLSWYLASRWQAPVNLASTRLQAPRGLLPIVLHASGLEPVEFTGPACHAEMAEGERYARLAEELGIANCAAPRWTLRPDQESRSSGFLEEQGLGGRDYVVCFPLGAASTLVKRWPAESFALALERATEGFATPVLLTGEANERTSLEAHAEELRRRGATVALLAGTAGDIGLLAGLLAQAKCFLGNDTGPAHLAQAYGTPGVVVFGGGTWPHYRPWGRGTVGVVRPLACFGCRWDCAFGTPICIAGVTVESVVRALEQVKANPRGPARVLAMESASVELQTLAGSAAGRYREAQEDRLARYRALVETEYARTVAESRSVELAKQVARVRASSGEVGQTAGALVERGASRAMEDEELERLFQLADAGRAADRVAAEGRWELIEEISRGLGEWRAEDPACLAAVGNANDLLRRQQEEIAGLRSAIASLHEENARSAARAAELDLAAAERLAALGQASRIHLAQEQQLRIFVQAATERLAALEATSAALQAETTRRNLLTESLATVSAALEESRHSQAAERKAWQQRLAAIEAERARARLTGRSLEEQQAVLRSELDLVTVERDRDQRSTVSERELSQEVLARRPDSLLQSVIRRILRKKV
jgi:ADP-heptose:LPS heptosyltransferase/polysaccharide pyruvyl transferase WcaK-like protein